MSPKKAKELKPINTSTLKVLTEDDSEDTIIYINELLKTSEKPNHAPESKLLVPHTRQPRGPNYPYANQKREIQELEEIQKLDPTTCPEDRESFLKHINCNDSQLTLEDQKDIEQIYAEFNDIFARHRLDIGINHEIKTRLTLKTDERVYSQTLPCPINLKEDLTVELAIMHNFGIITTLPFSKYASPIFAQRKLNGRLCLLEDPRKINTLISDDNINNIHPVSTLTDAAQQLASKKFFFKLHCSQAYHVLQMADLKSVQLLAFNFASRTFAYLRLSQGLSHSLSSFSSFMRENLDTAINADTCAQHVDDIGVSHNHSQRVEKHFERDFSMHPHSNTPAYKDQRSVRCQGSRSLGMDDLPIRRGAPESQDSKQPTII